MTERVKQTFTALFATAFIPGPRAASKYKSLPKSSNKPFLAKCLEMEISNKNTYRFICTHLVERHTPVDIHKISMQSCSQNATDYF